MVHVSEQSKSCAANGTSDVMTDMEEKLPGGAGPLREPCSSLQRKLLEISNSLSEAELTRMKLLARPKVNGFRLAKMRRGLELFKELESTGESHAYVRELLKGIRRYDLLVTLDTPLLDNTESGKSNSVFPKSCIHHFLKTWIQLK
ncbi:hypothetical protein OS493_006165 [Desmophyllum pertusum]|uniref:DED domain-containing protein n=1 Tax=Desmophyllum pertusum TaxID=174260 RepID=A0A9X0A4D3_9CNID|nr:hypothetical protein OS493_006165 [Desmophyllum pertusum]